MQTETHISDEKGATLVEYSLLLSLVALMLVAAVTAFQARVGASMNDSAGKIAAAM